MYGLSKSFTVKSSCSFQNFEIFSNIKLSPYFMKVDWIWVELVTYWNGAMYCKEKMRTRWNHEQHEKTKQRRSKDIVKVSLLILFPFCVCQFNVRFNAGSCSQKHIKKVVHYYISSAMFYYVTPVTLLPYFLLRFVLSRQWPVIF